MYALKPGFLDRLEVGVNLGLTNIIQIDRKDLIAG